MFNKKIIVMDTKELIGTKIDIDKISEKCREMNIQEIHSVVAGSGMTRAWSWGFRNPVEMKPDYCYRFTVSGHHHKGHVYIFLNFLDLFDIYYTSNQGTIKKIKTNIFIDELIETLDKDIERIDTF